MAGTNAPPLQEIRDHPNVSTYCMLLIFLIILSVFLIVIATSKFRVHPFLALLFVALFFGLASGMPLPSIVQSINDGFGRTIGSIGIVIIAGVIIGTFLEQSGGAYAMASTILVT